MRVLVEGQREMAERLDGVARLLERTQHQVGEDALFGLAGDFLRQALVMLRPNLEIRARPAATTTMGRSRAAAVAAVPRARPARRHAAVAHGHAPLGKSRHAERIAEGLRQLLEFEHLLRIGLFVDAMQREQCRAVRDIARRPDWRRA